MKNTDTLVFIDANLYLDLYRVTNGKRVLDSLLEQQDYIFVTAQVVEEVQRNKLQAAADFLTERLKQSEAWSGVPEYLCHILGDTAAALREKLNNTNQKISADVMNAAAQILERISRSDDEVSKALTGLFSKAVTHTPEEMQHARDRKERGNPPGKKTASLGDQLTWEQLLSRCKGKSKLWVISKDSDYYTKRDRKMFLNAFLFQDLARLNQPTPEVFCFDGILKGIRHFVKTTGVRAEKLPTAQESQEIEKELDSLPPRFTWLDSSMDDANMVAILSRQQMSPALWAAIHNLRNQSWPLGMRPDPDKTDK